MTDTNPSNEYFVRDNLLGEISTGAGHNGQQGQTRPPDYYFVRVKSEIRWELDLHFRGTTQAEAWEKAATWVKERKARIDELKKDIKTVYFFLEAADPHVQKRIVDRLTRDLIELLQGQKDIREAFL